ncbi:hypothetical protein HF319_00960 [Xanthomonas sp. Kuri4-1]
MAQGALLPGLRLLSVYDLHSIYDLRPLVTLSLVFAERGEDLYHWRSPTGASLSRSVAWLLPYLLG